MLDDLLPEDYDTIAAEHIEAAARNARRRGDFAGAAAILATGYERGGPAVLLEQAYTYAHYLAISRRMLRRGAVALRWEAADAITANFAASYDDNLIDRLVGELERMLQERLDTEREPSGALLLMAEKRLADGAVPDEVLALLPKASETERRADFLAARAHAAAGRCTEAEVLLEKVAADSDSAAAATAMLGRLQWKLGRPEAADLFDMSLRAEFVPVRPRDVPSGQLQFLSTIMGKYDIYAHSGGFVVVRKEADLVGVAMVGRQIFQVMMTPGYRQWTLIKRLLGRFVNVSALKSLLTSAEDFKASPADERKASSADSSYPWIVRLTYPIYDRAMRRPVARRLRPHLKRAGFAILPLLLPLQPLLHPARPLWRLVRPVLRAALSATYRFMLLRWLQAREVPQAQTASDAKQIFIIISEF